MGVVEEVVLLSFISQTLCICLVVSGLIEKTDSGSGEIQES